LIDECYSILLEKLELLKAQVAEEQRNAGKKVLEVAIASLAIVVVLDVISLVMNAVLKR
jgi:hypothetical protein